MHSKYIHTITDIISKLFNPITLILYLLILLFFGNTYLSNPEITIRLKLLIIAYISLLTIILPLIMLFIINFACRIYKITLLKQYKTPITIMAVSICYIVTMYIIAPLIGMFLAKQLFLSVAIVLSITSFYALFREVSLHMVALSILTSLIWNISIIRYGELITEGLIAIFIMGITASSLLYLQKNSLSEIAYSSALAITVCSFILYI